MRCINARKSGIKYAKQIRATFAQGSPSTMRLVLPSIAKNQNLRSYHYSPIRACPVSLSFHGSPTPVGGWVQVCEEPNQGSEVPVKAEGSSVWEAWQSSVVSVQSQTGSPRTGFGPWKYVVWSVLGFCKILLEACIWMSWAGNNAGCSRYMLCILEFINHLENTCQELTICQALFQELYVHRLTKTLPQPNLLIVYGKTKAESTEKSSSLGSWN